MMPIAATERSSLDLLLLSWPFSQVALLTADDLVTAADNRRIRVGGQHRLDLAGLEELHKCGVLVPLFRVSLDAGEPKRSVDLTQSVSAKTAHNTIPLELYAAAADGRVTDPASEAYEPWPTDRRRNLWPGVGSGYLYSRHQLLGLARARDLVGALSPERPLSTGTIRWKLTADDLPDERMLAEFAAWRALAITLSAIDTIYWPDITNVIKDSAEIWRSERLAFKPRTTLKWLRLSAEAIARQSEALRLAGSFVDVLGDFYDLVRRAKPAAWSTLRGEALVAMDYRMSADILHRFAAHLDQADEDPPLRTTPTSQQGLGDRSHSLDAALTTLQLSPHPAVVIAVEGKTDLRLVRLVMDLLGMPSGENWYRVIPFDGTKRDLSLLARYSAEPGLGESYGDFAMLDRPVTRFLVLTDAENKYATPADQLYQRDLLLKAITEHLPSDLKADVLDSKSRVVEIVTWGELPFEFAHFTPSELADALLLASRVTHPQGRAALVQAIRGLRNDSNPDIAKVFWKGSHLSKVRLTEFLWPPLGRKVKRAIERKTPGPPVMKALLQAHELAVLSFGQRPALRRRPGPPDFRRPVSGGDVPLAE